MITWVSNEHGHVCYIRTKCLINNVGSIPIPTATAWVIYIHLHIHTYTHTHVFNIWAKVKISRSVPNVPFLSMSMWVPSMYSVVLRYRWLKWGNIQCSIRQKWLPDALAQTVVQFQLRDRKRNGTVAIFYNESHPTWMSERDIGIAFT